MRDERLGKLARVLVDYSVEAGEGDQVLVFGGAAAEPLIKELYARLLRVGAVPVVEVQLPGMRELFFEHARDVHYQEIPSISASRARRPTLRSQSWRPPIRAPSPAWIRLSNGPSPS